MLRKPCVCKVAIHAHVFGHLVRRFDVRLGDETRTAKARRRITSRHLHEVIVFVFTWLSLTFFTRLGAASACHGTLPI